MIYNALSLRRPPAFLRRVTSAAAARDAAYPSAASLILVAGIVSLALDVWIASMGNLRAHLGLYLAAHGALFAIYAAVVVTVWRTARRNGLRDLATSVGGEADRSGRASWMATLASPGVAIGVFAIAFRAALVWTPASLSD